MHVNWFDAMRECSLRNMSLITIDTPEKNENLVALLNENFSNIVLTISKEEFIMNMNRFGLVKWYWRQFFIYLVYSWKSIRIYKLAHRPTRWKKSNPNCIAIGYNSEYEWADAECRTKYYFICEDNRFYRKNYGEFKINLYSVKYM